MSLEAHNGQSRRRAAELASAPITIDGAGGLDEAAQAMREHHVGSLVVTENDAPVGLVTDRDVALAALRRAAGTTMPKVSAVASMPLLTLPDSASMEEAGRFFGEHCVRRAGLVSPTGELVGVLSSDTVLIFLGRLLGDLSGGLRKELEAERAPFSGSTSTFGRE